MIVIGQLERHAFETSSCRVALNAYPYIGEGVLVPYMLAKVKGVRILPILVGSLVAMDKIYNLNAEIALDASGRQIPFLDLISRDTPVASLCLVKRLLQENSISFDMQI